MNDDFDPLAALDDLLSAVDLSRSEIGGSVSFEGEDPIVPAAHRLGACIGVPLMAGAVAATAFHRHRGGPGQDLHLDLRQAVHTINPGAFLASDAEWGAGPTPPASRQPVHRGALPDSRWSMGHGLGRLPTPGRHMVSFLGRAARYRQGRRGGRELGRLRARGGGERCGPAHLRGAVSRRVAGARTGSAARGPTSRWTRAHRQRCGPGLRDSGPAVRRCPRAVVHPRRRGAHSGPDPRRAGGRRARCHAPERLRARIHLRRGQRGLSERVHRPRQTGRKGARSSGSWPRPTWWSTTTARGPSDGEASARETWPIDTPEPCWSRSIATDRAARGQCEEAST